MEKRKTTRTEEPPTLHVLMLPWLGHGHLSPYLELASRLSLNNIMVHFCSTPINLSSIASQFNHKPFFPSINLVELHLPGLPSHLHTTKHLPSHLMPALKTAFDLSEPSFTQILEDLHPDLLIYDFIQPWAPRAAQKLNIPSVPFLITGATSTAFFCHYLKNPNEKFPFKEISSPGNDANYTEFLKSIANGITDGDRLLQCINLSSNFVAIRTFKEIESKYIDYLSSLTGKEIVPVGPLVPMDVDHESSRRVSEWLSKKERNSVLFVSFGSEYFMRKEEIEEIAHGLELSKVSFIWVVRFPKQEQKEEEERLHQGGEELLRGFAERIDDLGLILEGWAPQREILRHPSVGGFLTHCGWGSVMEGMRFGVPMVALPLQLDQPLNAKLVGELGVGVEIKRERGNDGVGFRMFRREEIAEGIRDVMVNEVGLEVRKKVEKVAELMGFKGDEEIRLLVEKIALLCTGGKERDGSRI